MEPVLGSPQSHSTLGGETGSHLAYTQKSEGQNLPERPAFALLSFGSASQCLPRLAKRAAGLVV